KATDILARLAFANASSGRGKQDKPGEARKTKKEPACGRPFPLSGCAGMAWRIGLAPLVPRKIRPFCRAFPEDVSWHCICFTPSWQLRAAKGVPSISGPRIPLPTANQERTMNPVLTAEVASSLILDAVTAADLMTVNPVSIRATATLDEAIALLIDKGIS